MGIALSSRLRRIADYIPAGARVIDVGTDHGYIPIWLLQNGLTDHAIATDIKPGPLNNAAKDAEKYGVSSLLELRLCDGLAGCCADDADTVIIAGMGGETIMGILDAAPWAFEKRLILQPQTKLTELRAWLAGRGLAIADASLVSDSGRLYQVWLAEKGEMVPYAPIDPSLLRKKERLLAPYTEDLIKRLGKQINGMKASAQADPLLLARLEREYHDILNIREEIRSWQA